MKKLMMMVILSLHTAPGQTDSMFVFITNGSSISYALSSIVSITFSGDITSVEEQEEIENILSSFVLHQNYPNPFNPSTNIKYELPLAGNVAIFIYDIRGRLVRTLAKGLQQAGSYAVTWNGRGDDGAMASTGSYFCRIEYNNILMVKKLLLIK